MVRRWVSKPSFEGIRHHYASGREAIPQIAAIISEIDICLFATRGDGGQIHAATDVEQRPGRVGRTILVLRAEDGRLVAELRADPSAVAAYRAEEEASCLSVVGDSRPMPN